MPELPEVETIAVGVNERIRGSRIGSVWVGSKSEPFKTPASDMQEQLAGKKILGVRRVGKHIVFDLASARRRPSSKEIRPEAQWIVHLGMTGRLLVCSADAPRAAHTHVVLDLGSNRELRFVDPRRFGRVAFFPIASDQAEGFQGPGKEPLSISLDDFVALFRGRKTPIKAALLNQKLLHGVGNIYADESLFRAGIRPRQMAGKLSRARLALLRTSLQTVLREAIARGGSSVSDYVDADGVRGFFQFEHRVYLRGGKPCLVCGTPIRRILIGGRGTHYCPVCQK
jgi:formamidopyrimidine-DNA glycosylase